MPTVTGETMEQDDRISRIIEYGLVIAFFAFVLIFLLLVMELHSPDVHHPNRPQTRHTR
jgi:hypothetical protein